MAAIGAPATPQLNEFKTTYVYVDRVYLCATYRMLDVDWMPAVMLPHAAA
jgi:hypothetical protein